MFYKKLFSFTILLFSFSLFADGYEPCYELDKLTNKTINKEITINCNNQTSETSNNKIVFDTEIKLVNQKILENKDSVNEKLNHFKTEVSNQYNIINWWLIMTSIITTITAGILLFLGFKTKKDIIEEVMEKVKSSAEIELVKISNEMRTEDYRSFDKMRLDSLKDLDKIIAEKYETYEEILIELEEKIDKIQDNKNTSIKSIESGKTDDPFE